MTTLDIIGPLYDVPGGAVLPGWHVNSIPAVPEWASYRVTPTAKRRVFAGMEAETCCYVFPDEATFLELSNE